VWRLLDGRRARSGDAARPATIHSQPPTRCLSHRSQRLCPHPSHPAHRSPQTATLYAQEGTDTWVPPPADDYYGYGYYLYDDPVTWQVHKIETSSAFMEMIACEW
jgi:hypothetical protein